MKKKIGFIMLVAGLTWGLAAMVWLTRWPHAAVSVALVLAGTVVLVVGMRREGPRDEELPTADGRRNT